MSLSAMELSKTLRDEMTQRLNVVGDQRAPGQVNMDHVSLVYDLSAKSASPLEITSRDDYLTRAQFKGQYDPSTFDVDPFYFRFYRYDIPIFGLPGAAIQTQPIFQTADQASMLLSRFRLLNFMFRLKQVVPLSASIPNWSTPIRGRIVLRDYDRYGEVPMNPASDHTVWECAGMSQWQWGEETDYGLNVYAMAPGLNTPARNTDEYRHCPWYAQAPAPEGFAAGSRETINGGVLKAQQMRFVLDFPHYFLMVPTGIEAVIDEVVTPFHNAELHCDAQFDTRYCRVFRDTV